MKATLLIIVHSGSNDQPSDAKGISSKPASQAYSQGWEMLWGKVKDDGKVIDPKSVN